MVVDDESLDNRSFATGVITSPISDTLCPSLSEAKIEKPSQSLVREDSTEPTMDETQSREEEVPRGVEFSPLKISYEKPRLCGMHFKTVSHLIATCLLLPLLFENVAMIHVDFHVFHVPIIFNFLAVTSSVCHVAFLSIGGPPKMSNTIATFWITVAMTVFSITAGVCLWMSVEPRDLRTIQFIVPQHYILSFGSLVSLILAGIAVYVELQARQYAVAY